MRWTPVVGSLAINAALLAVMAMVAIHHAAPPPSTAIEISVIDVAPAPPVVPIAAAPVAGSGSAPSQIETQPRHIEPRHIEPQRTSAWDDVSVRYDRDDGSETGSGSGIGDGDGIGNGHGHGFGSGIGNGLGRDLRDVAALRVPVPSKARPAKLLHPSRETEVEAAELFGALVTVDTDGDVVGARMTRSHPGSRGDTAASMIWQFRYSPALDDAGRPVRSTFEQTFAVR